MMKTVAQFMPRIQGLVPLCCFFTLFVAGCDRDQRALRAARATVAIRKESSLYDYSLTINRGTSEKTIVIVVDIGSLPSEDEARFDMEWEVMKAISHVEGAAQEAYGRVYGNLRGFDWRIRITGTPFPGLAERLGNAYVEDPER